MYLTQRQTGPAVLEGQEEIEEAVVPEVAAGVVVAVTPSEVEDGYEPWGQRAVLAHPLLQVFDTDLVVAGVCRLGLHIYLDSWQGK